jgi:sigma-E factor negative regulatory protein RseA
LSQDIAQLLSEEPTVLAPKTFAQKVKAQVVYLARPAGQFAIAASAAFLMILGVQQVNLSNDLPATQNQVFQPMPIGGIADPVSYNFQQPLSTNKQAQQQAYRERQRRLNALLNDHKQQLKLQHTADENIDADKPQP